MMKLIVTRRTRTQKNANSLKVRMRLNKLRKKLLQLRMPLKQRATQEPRLALKIQPHKTKQLRLLTKTAMTTTTLKEKMIQK